MLPADEATNTKERISASRSPFCRPNFLFVLWCLIRVVDKNDYYCFKVTPKFESARLIS